MLETPSDWRSSLCAAAEWRHRGLTAPATDRADSAWPLRALMERFVLLGLF